MFFSRRTATTAPACIRRLLVVEDDALVAFDHEYDLKSAGYNVVATVGSGEAAVAVLAQQPVDALVLDLNLAGDLQGQDIARLAHDRGIAVLLVSGDDPGDARRFASAHLAKPLTKGALTRALRALEAAMCRGEEPRRVAGLTLYLG
jgi:DNA-binding response OmpR family regulator